MSARLGPPRAVVGGARGLAQRFLARLAFGRQALLSPGVMRPCRVASDGLFFSRWGASHFRHICFGQSLRLSLWVSSVFSAPATLHPVTQQLLSRQRFFHSETFACVWFPFRLRRLFRDLLEGNSGARAFVGPGATRGRMFGKKKRNKNYTILLSCMRQLHINNTMLLS